MGTEFIRIVLIYPTPRG